MKNAYGIKYSVRAGEYMEFFHRWTPNAIDRGYIFRSSEEKVALLEEQK